MESLNEAPRHRAPCAGWSRPSPSSCALAGAAAAEVRILAFGDSLTAGSGLPRHEGFVPQLEAWLHAHGAPDATVINAGVSGETTRRRAGADRRPRSAPTSTRSSSSSAPTTCCAASTSARCARNLDGILTEIGATGLPALLAGLPAPPNYPADYRAAFKAAFRDARARARRDLRELLLRRHGRGPEHAPGHGALPAGRPPPQRRGGRRHRRGDRPAGAEARRSGRGPRRR